MVETKQDAKAKQTFETALKALETLVAQMESGTLSLDDMMKNFEKGRELVKFCTAELNGIQQQIEKVVNAAATPSVTEPLNLQKK